MKSAVRSPHHAMSYDVAFNTAFQCTSTDKSDWIIAVMLFGPAGTEDVQK